MAAAALEEDMSATLKNHKYRLAFVDRHDQLVYVSKYWTSVKKELQSMVIMIVFGLLVITFAVYPIGVFEDVPTLLLVLFGHVMPVIVMFGWTFVSNVALIWYWPFVASTCISTVVSAIIIVVSYCANQAPGLIDVPGCSELRNDSIPYMPFGCALTAAWLVAFALHVRWEAVAAGSFVHTAIYFIFVGTHVGVGVLAGGAVIGISSIMACIAAWNSQKRLYQTFKRHVSLRRKLASLVNRDRSRYIAQEQGQRIFELIKRSDHMVVEYNSENVFKFVSPSCKAILGYDPDELINRKLSRFVHPADQAAVKEDFERLRNGSIKHLATSFRRLSKDGILWVEMHAHVVTRHGFTPVVLASEHEVPSQSQLTSLPAAVPMGNDMPSEVKSALIAAVHELRHPIQAARSANQAMRAALDHSSALEDHMDTIEDSIQHIRRMMWDVFVVAAQNRPVVTVKPASYKLLALLQRLCKQFQFLTSVHIKVEISAGVPKEVRVDKVRLMQLLANAVTNAASHCHGSDGRMIVNVSKTVGSPTLRYEIRDEGVGLRGVDVHEVFVRRPVNFRPAGRSADNDVLVPDRGLGLSTCQQIVSAMNGKVGLSNSGRVTTLWFELPVTVEAVRAIDSRRSEPAVETLSPTAATASAASSATAAAATAPAGAGVAAGALAPVVPPHGKKGKPASPTSDAKNPATGGDASRAAPGEQSSGVGEKVAPVSRGGSSATLKASGTSSRPNSAAAPEASKPKPAAATESKAEPAKKPEKSGKKRGKRRARHDPINMHVLLVDDEQVNRRLGARMLERLGCTHKELDDGDQVAAALADDPGVDAILMDILMKRSDGAEVCQMLRNNGCQLPIIAMTGATGVRDIQRFMAAGFDLVLPKPFDIRAMGRALTEGKLRAQRRQQQTDGPEADLGITDY